jgi:hypothetical protein
MRDAMQAAICLDAELPLVTRNARHFERVEPLEVSSPTSGASAARADVPPRAMEAADTGSACCRSPRGVSSSDASQLSVEPHVISGGEW